MHRWLALATAAWLLAGCVSPTDPLGREDALEDAQQRYTDLIRWGELEKAALFVDPEQRAAYMQTAKAFAALRITDFEINEIRYGDDDDAVVIVSYRGYHPAHLVERTARERQEWFRVSGGLGNNWFVRPQLDHVLAALQGRAPTARN